MELPLLLENEPVPVWAIFVRLIGMLSQSNRTLATALRADRS
jgi:hypothetical protein